MPYALVYCGYQGLRGSPVGEISKGKRSTGMASAGPSDHSHVGDPSERMMATAPGSAHLCVDGSIAFSDGIKAVAARKRDEGLVIPPLGVPKTF